MTAAYYSASVIFFAAACVLRLLPRWKWPDFMGSDVYFHIRYARLIRAAGFKVPDRDPRVLGHGSISYPALFHFCLAWLGEHLESFVDRYSAVIFDIIAAAMISTVLVVVGKLHGTMAITAAALYLIAPALTFSFIGPRAFSMTPRNFAQTLYALSTGALLLGASSTSPINTGTTVAVIFLALMILSSKFSVQFLFFVFPLGSLLLSSSGLIAIFVTALVFAAILSRGFLFRQFAGQYEHLRWYWKLNQDFVRSRGNWTKLVKAILNCDLRSLTDEVLILNPIIVGLTRHFTLFAALIGVIAVGTSEWVVDTLSVGQRLALALTLPALAPWVLTSFGPFRVFGEAERYLEFAFPPSWFLLWSIFHDAALPFIVLVVGAIFFITYLLNLFLLSGHVADHRMSDKLELAKKIRTFGRRVVLPLDVKDSEYLLVKTDVTVCGLYGQPTLRENGESFWSWFFIKYPFVNPDNLRDICGKYCVELVVVNKSSLDKSNLLQRYDLTDWSKIFENVTYELRGRNVAAVL